MKDTRKVHFWGDWVASDSQNSQPFSRNLGFSVIFCFFCRKMAQKFFAQKIEGKQKCLSRWTLHFLFHKFFCISKHKNVASQKQWFLTIFANFEVFCHKTALKLFAQKIHFYQNYSLRLKSHFLFDKLFHSCDCFWMATDGKRHEKQSKFDKNCNFDPLGVEIELWVMNPKRCARSTCGGTGWGWKMW